MKPITLIGFLLIVIGLVSLAYGGINYTKKEKVLDIGPITAEVKKDKRIPLPPILGALALAGGVALVIAGNRSRA